MEKFDAFSSVGLSNANLHFEAPSNGFMKDFNRLFASVSLPEAIPRTLSSKNALRRVL